MTLHVVYTMISQTLPALQTMVPLPYLELNEKVEQLALLTRADLEAKTVRELRKLASGVMTHTATKTKAEMIEGILAVTDKVKARVLRDTPVELDTQGTPKERAETLYETIKTIAIESVNGEELTGRLIGLLSKHSLYEKTHYALSSQKSNYSIIKTRLGELTRQETDEFNFPQISQGILKFIKLYQVWVNEVTKEVNSQYRAAINKQMQQYQEIETLRMLKTAQRVLANPSGHHWTEVSKALALVTGRRMGEIHSSGTFQPVDYQTVNFSGQLKRKKVAKEAYEIPVLTQADDVVAGMDYLEAIGKRTPDSSKVNRMFSMALSRAMDDTDLTYKDLRALYAAICYRLYHDGSCPDTVFYGRILGHGDKDTDTAESYLKFNPTDIEAIAEYLRPKDS